MIEAHRKPCFGDHASFEEAGTDGVGTGPDLPRRGQQKVPAFVLFFFAADLILALGYLLNFAAGQPFVRVTALLDLDGEANLASWYSSTQLFIVAALSGVFAYGHFNLWHVRSWPLVLLPLLFLVLSLDETAMIHEWAGKRSDALLPGSDRKNTPFGYTGIWMFIIGIPGAATALLLIYSARFYFRRSPSALAKCIVGMLILTSGAVGVETLSNFAIENTGAFAVLVSVEETLEMVGVTVVLWGTIDLLRAHRLHVGFDRAEPVWTSRGSEPAMDHGRASDST